MTKAEFEACDFFTDLLELFADKVERIVCLGIGNFATNSNLTSQISAKYQLLLALSLAQKLTLTEIHVFDPVLSASEISILSKLGCAVSKQNLEGKYFYPESPTLYFLPHCPKQLFNNLLWSNWTNLDSIFILGNSLNNLVLNQVHLDQFRYIKLASEVVKGEFRHYTKIVNTTVRFLTPVFFVSRAKVAKFFPFQRHFQQFVTS